MTKNVEDLLLEQVFKKSITQRIKDKEEEKCEDFSNILRRWMAQIGKGKSALEKLQPSVQPQSKPFAPNAVPIGSKEPSAVRLFWEEIQKPKTGSVRS